MNKKIVKGFHQIQIWNKLSKECHTRRARFILQLESKIEPSVAKGKKLVRRDTTQKKHILSWWRDTIGVGGKHMLGGGDTAHKLLMGGTIGVGTPHNIERTWFSALLSLQEGFPTDAVVVGWVGGWFQLHFIATSWLHLASWNLPDFQLCWESKIEPECGNKTFDTFCQKQGRLKINENCILDVKPLQVYFDYAEQSQKY